jgi:hypothetical protein
MNSRRELHGYNRVSASLLSIRPIAACARSRRSQGRRTTRSSKPPSAVRLPSPVSRAGVFDTDEDAHGHVDGVFGCSKFPEAALWDVCAGGTRRVKGMCDADGEIVESRWLSAVEFERGECTKVGDGSLRRFTRSAKEPPEPFATLESGEAHDFFIH